MITSKGQTGLYIHWPFCLAKCPYCDFNVHVRPSIDHERWEAAYIKSLEHMAQKLGPRLIGSVFYGGGTPSLMNPQSIERILDKLHAVFSCANDLEITMESNPTSIENQKFSDFRAAGINRVSVGVQSFVPEALQFLGRKHSQGEAEQALEIAARHFDRFSFDLITARPGQTLEAWTEELAHALLFARGHLSVYQLTIERSTPFYLDHAQGKFVMPDEDRAADFYLLTQEILNAAGLVGYEVSNHALPGHESKHNLFYWHYNDYIGIGPGAHGRLTLDGQKFATRGHYAPDVWLARVEESGSGDHPPELIDPGGRYLEALMMGLRLKDGISLAHLEEQGRAPWKEYLELERLERARKEGWVFYDDERIWLSLEGRLRLNALIPFLMAPSSPRAAGLPEAMRR